MLSPLDVSASQRPVPESVSRTVSKVVRVQNRLVVNGPEVHRALFGEMLEGALTTLTQQPTSAAAWRSILKADDVIGLKFNRSGQVALNTTGVVAEALIASIVAAGWPAAQIVCIEAPSEVESRNGTTPAISGFAEQETDFGSGSDQLASVVDQVTAIIDVPYLKSHNIAGLTCCLKNLSHGLIKHPARYHRNGCSPYIADIVGIPKIRSKLRLCLVDALRIVFDKGPEPSEPNVSDEGVLLASFDPVASDSIALMVLDDLRREKGLPTIKNPHQPLAFLSYAQQEGLGVTDWSRIDLVHR